MKKIIAGLIGMLLLAGCAGGAVGIDPADHEAGGGRVIPQAQAPAANAPGVQAVFSALTPTPFQPLPRLDPSTPEASIPAMHAGQALSFGEVTFNLVETRADAERTLVRYQVSGLKPNYAPIAGLGAPWIGLPNGQRLEVLDGGGGGGKNNENSSYSFPALPAGVLSFTLYVPNNWSGKAQTWNIPIEIER